MATETVFFCTDCGHESAKWLGQCPGCGAWNTFAEQPREPRRKTGGKTAPPPRGEGPVSVGEAVEATAPRIRSRVDGVDRVLGGGFVPGSLVLLAGEPGVGKSTLLLQVAAALAEGKKPALYVSAEESARQVALRARRIDGVADGLLLHAETSCSSVMSHLGDLEPGVVVIDSVQSMAAEGVESLAGSPTQVRAVAAQFQHIAKTRGVPVILVGHVTKDGLIAGPKVLEHLVDVVLSLEGEPGHDLRVLRATKNRFGTVSEMALFSMTGKGLEPVANPSAWMLEDRRPGSAGSVVAVALEGASPLLVEVQALVSPSNLGTPRRVAHGLDTPRLSLLLAVLERHTRVHFGDKDVFVNLVGGLNLKEPGLDLAVAAALLSSVADLPFPADTAVFGEIGLMGEVRAVSRAAERAREAAALGFEAVALPERDAEGLPGIAARPVRDVSGLLRVLGATGKPSS